MTIFRVQHKKNYTQVNNYICKDNSLSYKAKGIWLYAFSRPDDWEFHLSDLIKQSTDGEKSVKSGLFELEKAGYLRRSQNKDSRGKFAHAEWEFYETPTDIIKEILPQAQKRIAEKVLAEKEVLLSTEELKTEKNHQPNLPPKVKPDKPKRKLVDGGFLNEMKKEFGQATVELAYDEFMIALNKEKKISDPQAYFRKICERLHYAIDDMPKQKCTPQEEKNNYLRASMYEHNFNKKGGCPHYSVTQLPDYLEFLGPNGRYATVYYSIGEEDFIERCKPWVDKLGL